MGRRTVGRDGWLRLLEHNFCVLLGAMIDDLKGLGDIPDDIVWKLVPDHDASQAEELITKRLSQDSGDLVLIHRCFLSLWVVSHPLHSAVSRVKCCRGKGSPEGGHRLLWLPLQH